MTVFSRQNYETYLYTLKNQSPLILSSTIHLYTISSITGTFTGSLFFDNKIELRVFELIDLTDGEIFTYSYEIFKEGIKIRWYDPQPHPDDKLLASTFPHHFAATH